ncbi:Permease of the drug/metabolite transporter (DMT) superfamily [Micromonospora viridifaciens]|uniref:Permease of the drug/metabolite transporter (DMT) superfamily n=1 Tax=Micromonospora viridifaciens TaxID=1881 RepID=A0A1C4Z7P3_MICVI|nr:DMT family transporter [Micromonospora viridifaciens]SCF29003.1 Permease of the drug/metabolite transporter (DMT) superfamily [Micromonospora viridifaciens]
MGRTWAWARVGVLALLWGSTFLWIELALDALTPVQVTLSRCVLGSLTLLIVCLASGRRLPQNRTIWGRIVVAAFFCNALPFAMFSIGQQTIDSGVAGVLNATTPLWSLLIGLVIGTERGLRPARLGGLLLGFAGVVLIFAPWQATASGGWGVLAVLVAAASYAVGFAFMGHFLVRRGFPTISLSAAQLVTASALTTLTLPAGGLAPIEIGPKALIAVVILGVVATGVTFHLTYRNIAAEGATNTATIGYLLPVVSVALGVIVLDEEFSLRIAIGMAVVLVGVALTRRHNQTSAPAPADTPAEDLAASSPAGG